MEGHDAPKAKPLSPSEIKDEAHKLEKSASGALSQPDSVDALKAFHKDVADLQSHGLDSVKQVFQQMQDDSKGWNPLLPNVSLTDETNAEHTRQVSLIETPSMAHVLAGGALSASVTADGVQSIGSRGHDGPSENITKSGNTETWKTTHEIEISTKQKSGDKRTKSAPEE